MKYLILSFFMAVSCLAAESESTPSTPSLRQSTTGFYPIWENTGQVDREGDAYLGLSSGHVGILGIVNVGVSPIHFVYRTPNLFVKAKFFENEKVSLSAQMGFYHLLEGASRSTWSPTYTSRIDNPDYSVSLFPVSVSASYHIAHWLDIHQTLTGLLVVSNGPIRNEIFPGHALALEFLPQSRHGLFLHWTEVGLWRHDLSMYGASYRYRNTWLEARMGYFYRSLSTGIQSGPLVGFGLLL